jgi:hypothetical protein
MKDVSNEEAIDNGLDWGQFMKRLMSNNNDKATEGDCVGFVGIKIRSSI